MKHTDVIIKRFLRKLSKNVDDTCIGALMDYGSHPDLIGAPLEILDKSGNDVTLTTANLDNANSRIIESADNVEFFYSESIIKKVFHESVVMFLDERLVNEYVGFDSDIESSTDEDF